LPPATARIAYEGKAHDPLDDRRFPRARAHQWLERLGLGRLPGDLRFRVFGREWYIPLASTIVLSMVVSLVARVI
jgi:hypothetical protein